MPIIMGDTAINNIASGGLPDLALTSSAMYSGAVLQVVQTIKTDVFAGGGVNTTFYDITGFTANITPSSNTNKILVMADMQLGTGYWVLRGKLRRNSADVTDSFGTARSARAATSFVTHGYENGATGYQMYRVAYEYLDSPATTSALTYGIAISTYSTYGVYMNRSGNDGDSADYYGCPSSTITLMEIKA